MNGTSSGTAGALPVGTMRQTVSVLALLLLAAGWAEAEPRAKAGAAPGRGATSPRPPVTQTLGSPGWTPVVQAASAARPTSTPFSLSGQTVCSRGSVAERPVRERSYWFDGASVGMPGYRCITPQ